MQTSGSFPVEDEYDHEYSYSARFDMDLISRFRNGSDPAKWDRMFSQAQRSMLLYDLLESTPYKPKGPDGFESVGIDKLILRGAYLACFPLHDGEAKKPPAPDHQLAGDRHFLYSEWARWKNWYRPQPLKQIRRYFGEAIGFYFVWLGFYTQVLVLPVR